MLQLPAPLAELAERQWQRLLERCPPTDRDELLAAAGQIKPLFGLSDFIADSAILAPERPALSFGALRELADATVARLNALGIGRDG